MSLPDLQPSTTWLHVHWYRRVGKYVTSRSIKSSGIVNYKIIKRCRCLKSKTTWDFTFDEV